MKKINIGIIESGFGNIASVINAIKYLNYNLYVDWQNICQYDESMFNVNESQNNTIHLETIIF